MSVLNVTDVTHMYGDQITFQYLNFRLLAGEHAGLVGVNGAGKSTLFRLLTGSLLPDAGQIEWAPQIRVGFLEQHIGLQAGTTIRGYLERAFSHLFEMEKEMNRIAERLADPGDQLEALLRKYGELQAALEHHEFYQISSKVEDIASGLGLTDIGLEKDVTTLSGGQKTKLLLAKLLLEEPQVLLLDEPTNYLDKVHIEWLTGYLKRYKYAYIVVSHDERFLNEIVTVVFHLAHQNIKRYSGNYRQFQKELALGQAQQQTTYEKQSKEIEKLEAFIDKNRIRKAKQAKSREKMLSRIVRVEKPTDGPAPRFMFSMPGATAGTAVFETKQLQVGYEHPLFKPMSLKVRRGDKIAIVGENGAGKSTLVNTLLGHIKPLGGELFASERLKTAYYRQEDIAPEETPMDKVWALRPDLTQKDIRKVLAMSGLTAEHIRKPIQALSGGEQAKVRLSELMLTPSHLLVLDEPTNHLDVRAKEALKKGLMEFQGTILLVSHEPAFYEGWVTDVWTVGEWSPIRR
ncbi:ABC-F family ATP-binding cassette domain-containing protein [Paenibacillus sp.]|jgi:ATPase subunit of ABC transporter with duplicated ATPase domains|uniref:ABC-F family ATP-binding cassette domain-containing protein n=1 Tax=Paenibacillus sp. TaxID=58172 RepID=UPI0028312B14|nr:ABC-F family ATP-binding cassette domain-containing protein [Paenibacillus sp.]MDR0266807.1 ATP-binding cassette domain-containing protein [Paenibacillus sp.]